MRFISITLKDKSKKWLYSLPVDYIGIWNDFVKVFLKKYFPHHKTQQLRKEITEFKQVDNEPFWNYLERFDDLLAQCLYHGYEKWRLCQLVYEGLNYPSKKSLESMCQGKIMDKSQEEAWTFLEELVEKTV